MKIRVKPFLTLRQIMGAQREFELEVEDMTIRGLLDLLCEAFGQELNDAIFDRKTNDVHETLKILINGRHYSSLPGKLETRLQESDEIALFPAIAGG